MHIKFHLLLSASYCNQCIYITKWSHNEFSFFGSVYTKEGEDRTHIEPKTRKGISNVFVCMLVTWLTHTYREWLSPCVVLGRTLMFIAIQVKTYYEGVSFIFQSIYFLLLLFLFCLFINLYLRLWLYFSDQIFS